MNLSNRQELTEVLIAAVNGWISVDEARSRIFTLMMSTLPRKAHKDVWDTNEERAHTDGYNEYRQDAIYAIESLFGVNKDEA